MPKAQRQVFRLSLPTLRAALLAALLALAPGAAAQTNANLSRDTSAWYNRTHHLREVTVESERGRYSRKNNPAVELMRRVVEARRRDDLANRDFYRYTKYQKLTLAANDITPHDLLEGSLSKIPGALEQVEACLYNNKLILPLSVSETVTQRLYRRKPKRELDKVIGERNSGISEMFQTGDMMTTAVKDAFTDVNIYDNKIRLFQHPITSPIGDDAIRFYRYYIADTLLVGADSCIHLQFTPNNPLDFGFNGDIFILNDGSFQVRRCELSVPAKSTVNFVDGLKIVQEFSTLPTGERVLTADDMFIELSLYELVGKMAVIRNTRLGDYAFDSIPGAMFERTVSERLEAKRRDESFWRERRKVGLTRSEARMSAFIDSLGQKKSLKIGLTALKFLTENFIETGSKTTPSKVDIGPITSTLTSNFIDGFRTRIGAQTTAALSPHVFLKGYYAHGWKSHGNYYSAEITYSFTPKEHLPREYPMRNITFASTRDICAPTDKLMAFDKDNVFTTLKWTTVDKMMLYNRQQLRLEREDLWGLRTTFTLTAEKNEPRGELLFLPLDGSGPRAMRTTELRLELRYAPGEKTVSSKVRRMPINRDAPIFTLSHAMGVEGFLGGQYRYNFTEATVFKRFWAASWGKIDLTLRAGAQWNRVPFPLLIMPAANLSFISQPSTFGLMNNIEFVCDRYAMAELAWDLNGKIFNRLPLIKRLKWREYIGVRALWSHLTDKNNPTLPQNAASATLMELPEGTTSMEWRRPYVEVVAGIHNIFRFFHVEYVRRLTYLDLPTATKQGVRFRFVFKF